MSGATHRMPQELSKWLFKRDIIAFLFSRAHKKMAYQAFSSPCRVCFSEALFKEASIVTLDVIRRNHIVTSFFKHANVAFMSGAVFSNTLYNL